MKSKDFLRLDARGQLDLKQSHDVLAGVAKACIDHGIDYALLDVRDASTTVKTSELYTLAKAFQEMGFRARHRLAVLHRYNASDKAAMFVMFANDRGWNVRAFEEFEEAIDWFNSSEVDAES